MVNPLIPKKENSSKVIETPHSAGILDDFAQRKNIATKEGTIEHVPTEDNHIANKKYVDDALAGLVGTDWTISQAPLVIHTDNYTDTNTTAHASFTQLDYASAGHTGFEPAKGADDNYVTDAEKIVIGNTSGTNSGNQTSIVGITGTKAQFDTAVTDGDIAYATGAFHDGFSDFVANEHLDWTADLGATNINNANITSLPIANTALVAGTNITLSTNTLNVDDAFLINSGNDTTTGTITAGGFTTTGVTLTGDHGTAATDQVVNVCYGTGDPPAANTTTEGALFIKYTA